MDSNKRSIAKTASWRIAGSLSTFSISYLVTGSFNVAGSIAVVQMVINTLLYYLHERMWGKIKWGLK
jgi:uncharacterized membrane protein